MPFTTAAVMFKEVLRAGIVARSLAWAARVSDDAMISAPSAM